MFLTIPRGVYIDALLAHVVCNQWSTQARPSPILLVFQIIVRVNFGINIYRILHPFETVMILRDVTDVSYDAFNLFHVLATSIVCFPTGSLETSTTIMISKWSFRVSWSLFLGILPVY